MAEKRDPIDYSSPLEKVFQLLSLLAGKNDAMGLGELAREMQIPKTTLHRITRQLEDLGYLSKEPGGRRLVLSRRMIDLAVDIISNSTAIAHRHSILRDLSAELGESCCIGSRIGYEILYLDDVIAPSPLTMRFVAGQRAPLHCTSQGKIYLAHMNDKEWDAFVRGRKLEKFTERTITDPKRLHQIVSDPEVRSFAYSDREYNDGVVGAAVPIKGSNGKIFAVLSFAAPSTRMSIEQVIATRPILERSAARLSKSLE